MTAPVFKFLTGFGKPVVDVFCRRNIVGIITTIGYSSFDLLYIGAVGQVFYFGFSLTVVYCYFQHSIITLQVGFYPRFTHFAKGIGGLDGGRQHRFGLRLAGKG